MKLSCQCRYDCCAVVTQVRTMAAVLLRRLYTSTFEEFWPEFSAEQQASIKEQHLVGIQNEADASIRKKMCECTAEFARNMLGRWW